MARRPHLVLLHGFTGSGESWREVRVTLPAEWSVFAPDLLGHASAGELGGGSFSEEVERLQGELEGKSPQSPSGWHLVGYSLGARLGLGLLATAPERFFSATLIGGSWGLESEAERRARRDQDEGWARLLEVEGLDAFLERWASLPMFASQRRLGAERLRRQRQIRCGHRAEGLAQVLRSLGLGTMPDYRERLAGFAGDVRLVVGESDRKFHRVAVAMQSWWPGARLEVVPGAGHNLPLEAPSEVARILLDVVGESGGRQFQERAAPARGGRDRGRR